ncbi:GntR family transcriptional regulator [Leifsonia aquatica]|uniref:DNA-binding GntR family transcriptional regulator n=1 Tax=Leifsonia aquatica TaxID=144185 RepID=A0A7W4YJW1_LEIAQ|nr:GntR family transcriptional regulator [Leifsonia aquatica]MBB2967867.1 DNA-binding GntR family transcriptional regulator [Leifsonia aquatica]
MASSRAVQAYDILRSRIMDGTYGAGYRLVIDQLAREHDISSVPWREALRRLEAEGWVDIVQNAGATVKTFDTNSWQRTMRLLARLEGLATALSAPNLTPEDIAAARQMNVRMREALRNLDTMQFGVLNRQFHELVCSKCDDPRLNELVMAEWVRMDLIRRSAYWYAPGRAMESVDEHDGILDLIEAGSDADTIEAAARDHDVKTLEAITKYDEDLSDQRAQG